MLRLGKGLGLYNPRLLSQPEVARAVSTPFYKQPLVLLGAGVLGIGGLFYLLSRKSKKGVDNATSS